MEMKRKPGKVKKYMIYEPFSAYTRVMQPFIQLLDLIIKLLNKLTKTGR